MILHKIDNTDADAPIASEFIFKLSNTGNILKDIIYVIPPIRPPIIYVVKKSRLFKYCINIFPPKYNQQRFIKR